MKTKQIVLLMAFLVIAGSASAFMAKKPEPAIPAQYAAEDFSTIAKGIRIQMEPGGRYAYVPKIDRPKIEEQLALMAGILDGKEFIEELSHEDRIRLFNAQEHVNALLLQHDANRVVCEKVAVTGSHRKRTVCMTYAEKQAARESADRLFRTYSRGISPEPNG